MLLGGLITLAGLVLAFYLRPAAVTAVRGQEESWLVYAQSRRDGVMFRESFVHAAREAGFEPVPAENTPDSEKT